MKKIKLAILLPVCIITFILVVITLVFGVIFFVLKLTSTGYTTIGLENYPTIYDAFEINQFLVPKGIMFRSQHEIRTDFPYESAYYYAYEGNLFSFKGEASVTILSIVYDEETYLDAKQYMFDNTDYAVYVHYSYNGYEFFENIALPRDHRILNENGKNSFGLGWFNMICYNDSRQTLIFLGFHLSSNEPDEVYTQQGWGVFLKEYFPQYNFDAGAPVESCSSTSSN